MPLLPLRQDIRCCNKHTDYPVPVLSTTKFNHFEFWCPHCGAKYELFDGFKYYPIAYKLNLRRAFFEIVSLEYLSDKTEDYTFYQRPDNQFISWSDADIALALYNLGFRHKPEDIMPGAVLYTSDKKMIKIVEHEGRWLMENEEGKYAPAVDVKKYDWALLPDPQFTANFLTAATS
jgi:hypothetical protein